MKIIFKCWLLVYFVFRYMNTKGGPLCNAGQCLENHRLKKHKSASSSFGSLPFGFITVNYATLRLDLADQYSSPVLG
jgi:hypothetical protein